MKEKYEAAAMKIIFLQESDVIVTSGTTDAGGTYDQDGDNTTSFLQ